MFRPPEYGEAAVIEASRIGTKNIGVAGSAAPESRALPSLPDGFAGPSASRLNADIRKIANAAVAIVLALNLIVASRTAYPDRQKAQRPIHLTRIKHAKKPTA
jgi:hypothetical protein